MTWVSLGFWQKGFGWLDLNLQEAGKVCQLNEKTASLQYICEMCVWCECGGGGGVYLR